MKKITAFIVLFVQISICYSQDFNSLSEENKVREILLYNLKKRVEGASSVNIESISSQFIDGALVIDSGNYSEGIKPYLEKCNQLFDQVGFSNHQIKTIKVFDDVATSLEQYDYEFVLKTNGKLIKGSGSVSSTLKKVNNQWKIVMLHLNHKRAEVGENVVTKN
jgi:hypothetical protein